MTEKKYRLAIQAAKDQYKDGLITKTEYEFLIELAARKLQQTKER